MDFAIVARDSATERKIRKFLKHHKYGISKKPNFVIVAGGDGTILYSERVFPQIPKILLRDNSICKKCYSEVAHLAHVLYLIRKRKFSIKKQIKLEAKWNGKKIIALNEIQVRNKSPVEAIRFEVSVNGKEIEDIGDGIIVSTSHGSSAYYYSVTGKTFSRGIGIAFNNSHKRTKNLVVSEKSKIAMKLARGDGMVAYDNDKSSIFSIPRNKVVRIKKSKQAAKFVVF